MPSPPASVEIRKRPGSLKRSMATPFGMLHGAIDEIDLAVAILAGQSITQVRLSGAVLGKNQYFFVGVGGVDFADDFVDEQFQLGIIGLQRGGLSNEIFSTGTRLLGLSTIGGAKK